MEENRDRKDAHEAASAASDQEILELTKDLRLIHQKVAAIAQKHYGRGLDDGLRKAKESQALLIKENVRLQSEVEALKARTELQLREISAMISYTEELQHSQANITSYYERLLSRHKADELTSLPKQEEFLERVTLNLELEQRDHVLVICMFDIGRFKRINDEVDHLMGDYAIKRAAKVLKTEIRSTQLPAGEERRRQPRVDFIDLKARRGYAADEFLTCTALDAPKDLQVLIEEAMRIVNRPCAKFDQIDWPAEYKEWAEAIRRRPSVATLKPTLDVGVVILRAGSSLPRVGKGSIKPRVELMLKWADHLMQKTKSHQKHTGRRRIFYKVVEFRNLHLREVLKEATFDAPPTE